MAITSWKQCDSGLRFTETAKLTHKDFVKSETKSNQLFTFHFQITLNQTKDVVYIEESMFYLFFV